MKILQLLPTLDPSSGGVARTVLATSRALAARGHTTEIASLDGPNAAWVADAGLPVHGLGDSLTTYSYSKKLLPWLRENAARFDRVIVNGVWQYHSLAAWRAFAGTATPYYVFPHGMLDTWFKRTYPLKHLKKWPYWAWAEYRVLRDAAAVIFTSEEERLETRKSFWLYRAREKICSLGIEVPPPASAEPFLARFPQLRGQRILLFLGRLHPKKGCDLLVDAFERLAGNDPTFTLVLAGPDQISWANELRGRAARGGCGSRIIFAGMLEGEMKWSAFAAAEAFVLPSHQENFGLAVAEALAVGRPVLISNRVNIWREIVADEAGYVENDDLAGTTQLLERWRQTTSDVRATMQENARRCFARRFEIERAVDSLLEVLAAPQKSAVFP
ncbi:MAG: glycosyltransferase [Chthoniobacterales bacterium]